MDTVAKILEFNRQNQEGQGLKILTPDQMLNRFPAQLKAENNSEKLKNEIRQILYSLHRSKKLTKTIYDNLIKAIYSMETNFMSTENSKTNEPHRFRLALADKLNLKDPNKDLALGNSSIYYTWKNIKSAYNHKKFKISAPTWNDKFNLPGGSYSVSDIQDYFEFYTNKIKNRIVFKTERRYKLELSSETMKLLVSTKKDADQGKDGEDVPKLESVEVASVHCNLINNNYQQVLFTFVPNKQFGQLITTAPHSLTILDTKNTEFSSIELWFTNQNSKSNIV